MAVLPQNGGVPNFRMRLPAPALVLAALILVTGSLLALMFNDGAYEGGFAAHNRTRLTVMITVLLTLLTLLAGSYRWWHPHLWRRGNSQSHHRRRIHGRRRP